MYGLIRNALPFYRKLVKDLDTYEFQINPYGTRVTKNEIFNKQMVIVWRMGDLKVSHINSFEMTKFAGYISSIYGVPTVHRGKVHNYLGIYLDYSDQGRVKVSIIKCLDSVLQEFPYNLGATVATPDADNLFKVCDDFKKEPTRGSGTELLPHSNTITIHKYQGATRHTDSSDIPHHMCKETR